DEIHCTMRNFLPRTCFIAEQSSLHAPSARFFRKTFFPSSAAHTRNRPDCGGNHKAAYWRARLWTVEISLFNTRCSAMSVFLHVFSVPVFCRCSTSRAQSPISNQGNFGL